MVAVEIDSNGDAEFYYDVEIDGTLNCNSLLGGYLLLNNDYGPRLYPYANYSGSLGRSSNAFATVYSYGYPSLSDKRQKENIKDINNALNTVKLLKGVKYDIKKEYLYDETKIKDEKIIAKLEKERKNKLGFLAQDVNEVLPEVVYYDDSTDIYSIDYTKVVPILVEAIKELSAEVDKLKSNGNLKSAAIKNTSISSDEIASLSQNIPNPFNTTTRIEMFIPSIVEQANLYIYNLQGEQIDKIAINERGETFAIIEAFQLNKGMYLYTLITDGIAVDTKKMILTE